MGGIPADFCGIHRCVATECFSIHFPKAHDGRALRMDTDPVYKAQLLAKLAENQEPEVSVDNIIADLNEKKRKQMRRKNPLYTRRQWDGDDVADLIPED